jgi:predicted TIM-barrel fold metal-dependent hydrolase
MKGVVIMSKQIDRIDVHHHIMPSWYVEEAKSMGAKDGGGVEFPAWTVESGLALMDRKGIKTAITSIATPGVHFGDDAKARSLARRANEFSARLVADHPDRFGAFAVLPLPDVDGALEELAYATDTLKLDGVTLLTSTNDRYLGNPAYDAVFAEMNRRKSVIFLHPNVPSTAEALHLEMPGALVEFVFDTTRAVANLIFSGTMERNPDLSIILPHAGGTVPYVAGRLALGALVPHLNEKAPKGALAYLKRFYYETALATAPTALSSLRELVEPSHILFGSDNPFAPEPLIDAEIQGLERYDGFDDATLQAIERDNALALFPRLRAGAGVRS